MNIRLKSYLILFATFSMGLAVGVLLAMATMKVTFNALGGRMMGSHPPSFRPMGGMDGSPGRMLERHLENIVEPTEPQREKLQPLLKKYQERLGKVMDNHLESVRFLMDSLDLDLQKVLSPEQMEKWKNRPRSHRMPGGPGGPMRPDGPRGPGQFRGPPPPSFGDDGPPPPPRE
jgi:hypothetical protein